MALASMWTLWTLSGNQSTVGPSVLESAAGLLALQVVNLCATVNGKQLLRSDKGRKAHMLVDCSIAWSHTGQDFGTSICTHNEKVQYSTVELGGSLCDGAMSDHSLLVHLHLPGAAALVPAFLCVEGGHVAVATWGQPDLEARQVPGPSDPGHVLILVLSPAAGQRHEAATAEAEGDAADPYALGLSTFPLLR